MSPLTQRALGFLAVLMLVALAIWRSHAGTALDTFTVDEPWHVVAGAAYARSGDFSLNPEHPPLAKLWVGAQMPDSFTMREATLLSEKSQERDWVEETMYYDNDPQLAQKHARIGMWSLHAVLLAALGLLLWRACGFAWALGTLAYLAIEPTVGAHLPVVMTDLPLALTLLVTAVATGLLAAHWQWRWVLACGAAIGLALGAKHSAIPGIGALLLVLLVAAHFGWRNGGWREVLARHLKAIGVGIEVARTLLRTGAIVDCQIVVAVDHRRVAKDPRDPRLRILGVATRRHAMTRAQRNDQSGKHGQTRATKLCGMFAGEARRVSLHGRFLSDPVHEGSLALIEVRTYLHPRDIVRSGATVWSSRHASQSLQVRYSFDPRARLQGVCRLHAWRFHLRIAASGNRRARSRWQFKSIGCNRAAAAASRKSVEMLDSLHRVFAARDGARDLAR
ncbi:MAG: phospholipid carrier-dependent glycosyltransferase [Dokdonella sp.]